MSHHLPSLQQDLQFPTESAIFTQDRTARFIQFLDEMAALISACG